MKKTLILVALVAASVTANSSIKHRLGQVKAKNLAEQEASNCPCNDTFNLPPPGQGIFNGFGQSASVSQSE